MTLHCVTEMNALEVEREIVARPPMRHEWLSAQVLASFAEINTQLIEMLIAQARVQHAGAQTLAARLRSLLFTIDAAGVRRAAACPYLLVDAGFAHSERWDWAQGFYVADAQALTAEQYSLLPKATALAYDVFTLAWCLTRTPNHAVRPCLGMPERTAHILAACSLGQITRLARMHPYWLQPRWSGQPKMWQDLLGAALKGDGAALERARMRGVQLLAAEARSSALR